MQDGTGTPPLQNRELEESPDDDKSAWESTQGIKNKGKDIAP